MISSVLFAPHSDDEALFASYTIMREKPLVVIVTDGTSHQEKFGIDINDRRAETLLAMHHLGVSVEFLGISEGSMGENSLASLVKLDEVSKKYPNIERVYAPAKQGGHPHHDILCYSAQKIFGKRCLYYSTYSKESLKLIGQIEITPTEEEKKKKEEILSFYKSQIKINPHHFEAVKNKSEYLNLQPESWRA